jgi:site-specific recombinase XerD
VGETITITMTPDAMTILKELAKKLKENGSRWVFPTQKPLDHYKWKAFIEEAGLPAETRWHDLRHTFATRLVHKGINAFILKELLGHKNVSMTERYFKAENSSLRKSLVGITIAEPA